MLAETALLAVLSVERGPGAEACVDEAHLARSVERRLKRRVFVPNADASLRLRVVFSVHNAETEARIALSSIDGTPRGTRALVTAGHCSALDDSLALSVALLVDEPPEPVQPESVTPRDPQPAPATPKSATPPSNAATTSRLPQSVITIPPEVAAPREPWHARLGAGANGAWGVLPGVRPGVGVSLGIVPRHFAPILLQGEAYSPATARRDAVSGAHLRLLRVGLAVCPEVERRSRVSFGVCAGQQLGWLTVQGYGFDHESKEQRLSYWLTLGAEGRLQIFSPVSLRAYLGGEVPVIRDRFTSGGSGPAQLFQPSWLAVSGEIGVEAALW